MIELKKVDENMITECNLDCALSRFFSFRGPTPSLRR